MTAPSFTFTITPTTPKQGAAPFASQADPLGHDVWVREDIDPSGRSASGLELVDHAILHRLSEDTLLLTGAADDQVDFGENVRKWIGEALSQDVLDTRAPRLEEVIRRDPRIASAAVALTIATGDDASRYHFTIRISAVTVRGQAIDRIVGVSQVTVEFLAQGR
jgi:hypothetical protein